MSYLHNQWYDISCATLYNTIYKKARKKSTYEILEPGKQIATDWTY